jgi:hypothetical protein
VLDYAAALGDSIFKDFNNAGRHSALLGWIMSGYAMTMPARLLQVKAVILQLSANQA